MKIKIKSYNAVASWRWNTQINKPGATDQQGQQMEEEEDEEDEEDDVCGICQVAFEGCCPNCKVPGDDCPLSECRGACANACAWMAVGGELTPCRPIRRSLRGVHAHRKGDGNAVSYLLSG